MQTKNNNIFYHLVAFLTVAIWGTTFVSTKVLMLNGLSPAQIFTLRFSIAYVLMLGTNLLVYIFLPQLSGLYGLTTETTAVVHDLLLWHCIFASLFYPAGFCIPAALRAAGDVRYPMVISVASMLVFRVGLSFVFVRGFGLGVVSIWMAIFVDWGFRAVLFGLRFHSNIWQKKKLL